MTNELATCDTETCTNTENTRFVRPAYRSDHNEDAYTVEVLLPGVAKSDLNIALEDNVLELKATRDLNVPESWTPIHNELETAPYRLALKLNIPVDEQSIAAKLENGILNLTLPLREAAKPRQIKVA